MRTFSLDRRSACFAAVAGILSAFVVHAAFRLAVPQVALDRADLSAYGTVPIALVSSVSIARVSSWTLWSTSVSTVDYSRASEATVPRCEVCRQQGISGRISPGLSRGTLLGGTAYFDEARRWHSHDPNVYTTEWFCSNGHAWTVSVRSACWCEAPK